ncbi:hypothetical protein M0R04_12450 [Candidatus Dojkabacteria bacterium]|jgi:hypothetical protein|nr:hypothetical protein [Candidatus Dojkabacteria bacterium]
MNPYELQEKLKLRDITVFAHDVLGMPTHMGMETWFEYSNKSINILKPGNQWGKTTAEAVKHIYHAVCKPQLDRLNISYEDRMSFKYKTLNFGKTYEIAKGVSEYIMDIAEGHYLLPDGTYNKSLLKGWAIIGMDDYPRLPQIKWWNHSSTLIRSYDQLGESFKRLRLAYVSGDECGDIPELRLFLNGTLLPRLFFFQGSVDLVGTSQPKGLEYEEIAQEAEEDMVNNGLDSEYFVISFNVDPDMASVYTNKFMPKDHIKKIEKIADENLRKQVIYGQYVDNSDHLYTWDEVNQMFTDDIPYDRESGFSEVPLENQYYVFWVDMAASADETSCTCIKYNIKKKLMNDKFEMLPHKIVFHKAWKGKSLPLSLQYAKIKEYYNAFKRVSPLRTKFGYDAGSLGGKNAEDAFKELHGYPFPPKGRSYADVKAEGFGKVKEVLGRNRSFIINEVGKTVDKNKNWGGIKASSKLFELKRQLEIASKEDAKIKNDQFSSFMMALHFVESRAIKVVHSRAVDYNVLRR